MKITGAYICTSGDASVGIGRDEAMIASPGEYLLDLDVLAEEDHEGMKAEFRESLRRTFSQLWDDETVGVELQIDGMLESEIGMPEEPVAPSAQYRPNTPE